MGNLLPPENFREIRPVKCCGTCKYFEWNGPNKVCTRSVRIGRDLHVYKRHGVEKIEYRGAYFSGEKWPYSHVCDRWVKEWGKQK